METHLVTGSAGFIGFHVCQKLLQQGHRVVGLDNFSPYYDVQLKRDRAALLTESPEFTLIECGLEDRSAIEKLFRDWEFSRVIHLAAQAGVRYSLTDPHAYVDSNLVGFMNILEGCRHAEVPHLVYASSSSVYGANESIPFSEHAAADHPISLYAATKRANELIAHSYSHLYGLPTTGLRFFTVYGPWGRPDMALFLFTRKILAGEPIDVFNEGQMRRDFTYIDDITEGILRAADSIPVADSTNFREDDPSTGTGPYRLFNIGNHTPVELMTMIELLEQELGQTARKNLLPMQPGDVVETFADVSDLMTTVGFSPSTPLQDGIQRFVAWYRDYYKQ
ncbi:NAD-dependent epimerase [Calycomorphotria hydatis]|uniref:UDP-glucose 4-epimerase n=1 Tax=Calycomorphotria hydatis TaxID=2528027 RepID=A0A517TBB4_9PLAN|nr:NAD-dependent epimerase [Calycomorphotria hydatis]QDT65657.1 UDP-glucose 4-epimerase [Calycomorphotria hydatis]